MPWNPNVPNVINRVQDDLAAMRENFQHLAPLAQAVDELQTVSGLAAVANELQTVSELAPYVQALLSSRIVEHNLDVADPPNGYYVRWENGLQVCFGWVVVFTGDGTSGAKSGTLPLPASFSAGAALWAGNESGGWRIYQSTALSSVTTSLQWWAERKDGVWQSGTNYPIHFIAVGRWK